MRRMLGVLMLVVYTFVGYVNTSNDDGFINDVNEIVVNETTIKENVIEEITIKENVVKETYIDNEYASELAFNSLRN